MHRLSLGLVLTLLGAAQAFAETPASSEVASVGSRLGVGVVESLEARQAGYDGGVRVETVERRSAGAQAGIREADLIVQLGGDPIRGVHDLSRSLAGREAGRPVAVKVLRNGHERVLTATPTAATIQLSSAPRVEHLTAQVETELADALDEGTLSWSLPEGRLVASLEDGHDFAIHIDGKDDEQRLVIELDGEVVFDSQTSDGDLVIDLDLD